MLDIYCCRQNLEKKDAELRNKLAEQSRHAEAVRQNKEKIQADGGAPDQTTESAWIGTSRPRPFDTFATNVY